MGLAGNLERAGILSVHIPAVKGPKRANPARTRCKRSTHPARPPLALSSPAILDVSIAPELQAAMGRAGIARHDTASKEKLGRPARFLGRFVERSFAGLRSAYGRLATPCEPNRY